MTVRERKSTIALTPGDPEAWIRKAEDRTAESAAKTQRFTASLTIDITPGLHIHIKVTAVQRGRKAAEAPRELRANFVKCHGAWFDE